MLKLGIVGTGMMLRHHHKAFSQLPDVTIVGCTRDYYGDSAAQKIQKNSLEQIAGKLGMKAYRNFDEMVADKDVTAMVIASINPYHFDQILSAISYGKHVLVEKPMVAQVAQFDEIASQILSSQVVVFPGHNFVYRPSVIKAKEIIDAGKLGTIIYASFISCFRSGDLHAHGWRASNKLAGGGALIDSGHHQVYQSLYLLGVPTLIQGFSSRKVLKHMDGEDFGMLTTFYKDGMIANIGQGHGSDYGDIISGIKIVGDQGNLVITDACYHNGVKVQNDGGYEESFFHQAKHFINCIENGASPISSLDDAQFTLRIIQAAYKSAETFQVVTLQ